MPVDYSKYPPNWKKEIVPRILERAENCCEDCGVGNKEELWSIPITIRQNGINRRRKIWVKSGEDMYRISKISDQKPKQVRVILTVAHLDHDEENHEVADSRLRALCQWCHLNYDVKEKMRRIKRKGAENGFV